MDCSSVKYTPKKAEDNWEKRNKEQEEAHNTAEGRWQPQAECKVFYEWEKHFLPSGQRSVWVQMLFISVEVVSHIIPENQIKETIVINL